MQTARTTSRRAIPDIGKLGLDNDGPRLRETSHSDSSRPLPDATAARH